MREPGCDDEIRELRLEASLIERFLTKPGAGVFPALADSIGAAFPGYVGVVAWPASWGRYSIAFEGAPSVLTIEADVWARLPGEGGWTGDGLFLEGLSTPDGASRIVAAVPLREKEAVVGFLGLLPKSDYALASLDGELALLRRVVGPIQAFAVERVRGARLESIREITTEALEQSERRFQDFIESSRDMIYIANDAGIVVLVNKAGEEMLGRPRAEILGRPFASFCPFEVDRDYFMDCLRSEGFVRDFEMTLQRPDSSILFVTETATALREPEGRVREVRGIVRDISERIRSQRELWRANMELTEANDALKRTQLAMMQQEKLASIGQLAAGIAHEINNPLGFLISDFRAFGAAASSMAALLSPARESGVTLAAADLREGGLDCTLEEIPTIIAEMDEGFVRIAEIVSNLKTFARSGEDSARAPYDFNEGVKKTLVIARNEIKYVADVDLDCGEVPPSEANEGELNQVLLNLLVNAAQAIASQNRPEKGRIWVTTGGGGGISWIEIADDGPGIPEKASRKIFEPFFTTKEPGRGTGLGLSISYDIVVRKHGGKMTFRPREGGGTIFRVELPSSRP